jgi:hypothetical protein
MKVLRAAAMLALLTGPAYAQMPNLNLMPEVKSKTQEEKDADEARDKAYQDSLRKIPDGKQPSSDPWGTVRSNDAPKSAAKAPAAKPKTKTGNAY